MDVPVTQQAVSADPSAGIELRRRRPSGADERLASVEAAVAAVRDGRVVVVADRSGSASVTYVVASAACASADLITFMAREGRGLIWLALTPARCDELALQLLPSTEARPRLSYTITVEARDGVTTGISSHDRARTVAVVMDRHAGPDDLLRPGHVMPIRTAAGGVLEHPGFAEAAVELAQLSGLPPAAIGCGVLADDGSHATPAALVERRSLRDLVTVSTGDVAAFRARLERRDSR